MLDGKKMIFLQNVFAEVIEFLNDHKGIKGSHTESIRYDD